jgi:hypothetical protein
VWNNGSGKVLTMAAFREANRTTEVKLRENLPTLICAIYAWAAKHAHSFDTIRWLAHDDS